MDTTRRGITVLMKSAATGQRLTLPDNFYLNDALPLILEHQLISLAYSGALNCGIDQKHPTMTALFQPYFQHALISEKQMAALRKLFLCFEEHAIDYLPLKGCNMKLRYPKPELRSMGDADILIRVDQYPDIVPILEQLGFSHVVESDHEFVWKSKALYLELHKRLIPSYNKDYAAYFQDGWQMARPVSGSRFEMTPEDEFLFQFTHFAKHYRDGGIGCRHILDQYVFLRAFPGLDLSYVENELKKLKLLEFYQNIRRLLEFWFEDGPADPVVEHMTDYIFASGNFGSMQNHVLSQEAKKAKSPYALRFVKARAWLRVVFPQTDSLMNVYPVLRRHRWLTPLIWIWRWCKSAFSFPQKLQQQAQTIRIMDAQDISDFHTSLQYVGLDFHFDA